SRGTRATSRRRCTTSWGATPFRSNSSCRTAARPFAERPGAHGLLRVVRAVPEAVCGRGPELNDAEDSVHARRRRPPEQPKEQLRTVVHLGGHLLEEIEELLFTRDQPRVPRGRSLRFWHGRELLEELPHGLRENLLVLLGFRGEGVGRGAPP